MDEIERRIRQYGQKRNQIALQKYVQELDTNALVSFVQKRYNSSNFNYVWDYIMQSFTNSPECHRKRFEVVLALLHELEKGLITTTQCNSIITRLCTEFPKFKPLHLIRMCTFCLECIQKGTVSEMCWKDIIPDVLNVIINCHQIEYNDQSMSGMEYKTQLINSLCMMTWSPAIVTAMASMFIDAPLTKEEHLQVVNKLGQQMEKLTCQELPSFVYQLLKLCRYQNCRSIYLRLQNYFGVRCYSKIDRFHQSESETSDLDVIEDSSTQDAIEVESTILFHIYQSSSTGSESTKDYLSSFKHMLKSPEFILHPFQITVLLTISNISNTEEQVMDILKTSIAKTIQEDLKKNESCWFREMISSTCKVEEVINQVMEISCSIGERYLVVQGLVQLAYTLLAVGQMLGRDGDLACERQWQIGKMILLKVIKKKRQTASCIISSLINHIITGRNVAQYIDCIHTLCHKMPLIMLENQSCIIELLEYLVQGSTADLILSAILPLIKISSTIRDHLILLLRKSLYSRVMETKQMAVVGFLKLIKTLKVSNLAVLSQSSSSSSMSSEHSVLTQVSLSCTGRASRNVFTNEALCLEVLGILRRCFMQQAEIRSELYNGLYDAVCMNPELGIPVIDILWIHFNDFYVSDQDELPPVNFSNITVVKGIDVKLLEPLGKLIYTVGLIITKIQEDHEDNTSIIAIKAALESLCVRMSNCELIHFELDDGTDLLDNVPESEHKLFVLKESLSIYDALIGYKICSWGPNSNNIGQQINNLFQCHIRLMNFSTSLVKSKKGDKRKHADETSNTQPAHNVSHNDNFIKNSPKSFEPKTILDFQTLGKVLHLLHEANVNWTTATEAAPLKTKPEIHQYMLRCTIRLIKKLKSMRTAEIHSNKMYYNYMTEIACVLYNRCITHFDAILIFDSLTANLVLECIYIILGVISLHYRNYMTQFLNSIAGNSKDEELSISLLSILQTYQKLLDLDEIDTVADIETHKLQLVIINTIALLSHHAPLSSSTLSLELLQWIKNYLNKSLNNKQVLTSFFNLALTVLVKFKNSVGLLESMASRLMSVLGAIDEHEQNFEELKLINEESALTIYPLFCNKIKMILDEIDLIIARLRSEFGMLNYPGEENTDRRKEYLKSKERGVCCQLCPIITIIHTISNTQISPGNASDTLLKTITHLYSTLTTLTKYFILRSSKLNIAFQGARFEKVVRLAGKQLSSVVYHYIIYIEGFHKQSTQNTQSKNKKLVNADVLKSKVLRETRLIPKVVYEMEQFGKTVIQLSKKTQVDLSKFVGQGTSRDFRIKGLQAVLDKVNDQTIMNESTESVGNEEDEVEADDSSDREVPSASKRMRRS